MALGDDTDVTFFGGNLAGVTGVWTNIPGSVELAPEVENNGQDAARVTYRFHVPDGAAVGVYGYRVATGQGVSSMRLLMVDDLPSVSDAGNNKSPAEAQVLTLPVAVDGVAEAESFDFYKFNAAAGQRISVEVFARRLGSPLDPVVRLLDTSGRELAYSDDVPGLAADGRFEHQFAEAGEYLIEVRDISYGGGGNHRYRLRIGNFPLATNVYPMGAQAGSVTQVTVAAPGEDAPQLAANVTGDARTGTLPMGGAYPQGQGSAALTMVVAGMAEHIEFEPNDATESASPVSIPGGINGRFERSDDRDYFSFDGTAGQRFRFTGQGRTYGAPTDLYLRLFGPDGKQIAEAEDSGASEGVLDATLPADGSYRLMVEDLHRRGGPEFVYRVEVTPYQPGFSLALEAEKFDVPQGGVLAFKITSARRDYNGPITLTIEGLDPPPSLAANVIPEGQNETVLRATLSSALVAGPPRVIRVVGQAKIGETDYRAAASTLTPLRGALSGLPYPPQALQENVGLGVGPTFPEYFQLALATDAAEIPQLVGQGTVRVKVERSNGFEDAVALAVEGLPPGFGTGEIKPLEKGQNEIDVPITCPPTIAEGEYRCRIRGSATFQNQPRTVVLADVPLRVVKPIAVSGTAAGPLTVGAAQKLKITLARRGGEPQPVNVQLENLPQGITGPAEITIPADAGELESELTAAEGAATGAATLRLLATTAVAGRQLTVRSEPVTLEIAAP